MRERSTDWIVLFQKQIAAICDKIRALLDHTTSLSELEREDIHYALQVMEKMHQWALSLPLNERIWRFMDLYNIIVGLTAQMARPFNILNALPWTLEDRLPRDMTLEIKIKTLVQDMYEMSLALGQVDTYASHTAMAHTDVVALSPIDILMIFTIGHSGWLVILPSPIKEQDKIRLALYHPYYTYHLVGNVIRSLTRSNEEKPYLSYRFTASFFEISITLPSLRLRPGIWNEILNSLHMPLCLEILRELGGTLEPLTWNTGQGEGVIVRLPWASA